MRSRRKLGLLLLAVLIPLSACTGDPPSGASKPGATSNPASPVQDPAVRAAEVVATFSDEDLVGQVFMPYAYGNDADRVSAGSARGNRGYAGVSTPTEMINKYRLGGVILVGFSADDPTSGTNRTTNVESPAQVRALTGGMQAAAAKLPAKMPLLIGIDQEYGQVTRVKDGMIQLPSALALGAAANPTLTENAWRAAGNELAAIGINVDFAPVADVLGDRPGGAIGSRAFGSDPASAAVQVAAAVRGMQAAGVAAALKHFPGHGHTTVDSHTDLPVLAQNRAALDSGDLPPFKSGIEAGAGLVMTGHLDVRAIDPGTPATFSTKVLVDLLRTQLGFGGVVVSDALNMAPARRGGPGPAAVEALRAGNDILLMPPNLTSAHKGVLDALRGGQLPRTRLVEAVTRILTLKFRLAGTPQPDASVVDSQPNRAAALAAAAGAVTVLRGACSGRLVGETVRVTAASKWDRQRQWLEAALKAQGLTVAAGGSQVHLIGYGEGASQLDPAASVTVAMDTPYILASARSANRVATYSSSQVSMEALAAVLAGKAKAPGRSPVAVNGLPRSACVR